MAGLHVELNKKHLIMFEEEEKWQEDKRCFTWANKEKDGREPNDDKKQTDRSFKIKLSYELRKHLDRAVRND